MPRVEALPQINGDWGEKKLLRQKGGRECATFSLEGHTGSPLVEACEQGLHSAQALLPSRCKPVGSAFLQRYLTTRNWQGATTKSPTHINSDWIICLCEVSHKIIRKVLCCTNNMYSQWWMHSEISEEARHLKSLCLRWGRRVIHWTRANHGIASCSHHGQQGQILFSRWCGSWMKYIILLRLWKFAEHHKGPKISYIAKSVFR